MPTLFDENLVPHWHRNKSKFMSILRAYLEPLEGSNAVIESMSSYYDIETASGAQLDTIGRLLGVGRTCNRAPDYAYRTLNDDLYRFVLMARVLYATWDGTVAGFVDNLDSLFPDVPHGIVDHQDCTYDVELSPDLSYDKPLHILFTGFELLPHPVGVLMNIALRFTVQQTLHTYHAIIGLTEIALGKDNPNPQPYIDDGLRDENGDFTADENGVIMFD